MKLKKIFAGMAALALSASMVISASAATEIPVEDAKTDAWSNCFQSYENEDGDSSDDYLDARTFTKDKDLTITLDFEWTDMGKSVDKYVLVGPGTTHEEWLKFGDPSLDKIKTDFPQANHLEAGYSMDGEAVVKDKKTEPVFLKKDGFIQINDQKITSVTFTIPKDYVNKMIETANKEDSWDGVVFQVKNMKVTKVTTDQDNVKLASQIEAEKASEGGDSKAEESKAEETTAASEEESKAEETTAASEEESKAEETTAAELEAAATESKAEEESSTAEEADSGLSTGAIIAIVAGVVVVLAIVIVVVKKKKD